MMVDVVISIFLIGTLGCEIALVVLFYRVAPKLGDIFNARSERQEAPGDSKSTGRSEIRSRQEIKVEDLPPEAIAPSLKNPPRPEGGFGSPVGKVDDSS